MDYVVPSEAVSDAMNAAVKKAGLSARDMLIRGALAGAFLGYATSLVFVSVTQGLPALVGAIIFPVGFVMLVLLGFVAVLGWAARHSLLPSRPVTVVPVLTSRAELQQAGTPLFQAAGWVEPRPTPTLVTALAEGFIDELLVVEGQEVEKGETVIARLNDRDARLALDRAKLRASQEHFPTSTSQHRRVDLPPRRPH